MKMVKSIAIILLPAFMLAGLGFILEWHFIYIIIGYCAGIGIGFLALFTLMQVKDKPKR